LTPLNDIDMLRPEPIQNSDTNVRHMTFGGQLILRHEGHELYIDHADPQVFVTSSLIGDVIRCQPSSYAALVPPVGPGQPYAPEDLVGRLLRIEALNRTVIYRLVAYDRRARWYRAGWPD
jgi:hypothetical protein